MVNEELDYTIPNKPLTIAWLLSAFVLVLVGLWSFSFKSILITLCISLLWVNLYSTILHYALDAKEFTRLPLVGAAFVTFQSHHFPRWINTIHRKPLIDLFGELTPLALINLSAPVLLFRLRSVEAFVAWGILMTVGCYGTICHRWAHQPPSKRPRIATTLQRFHLALDPKEHWAHHALAASGDERFVPNFDLSFGWSNALFNRVVKVAPSPLIWMTFIAVATFTQVPALTMLIGWLK